MTSLHPLKTPSPVLSQGPGGKATIDEIGGWSTVQPRTIPPEAVRGRWVRAGRKDVRRPWRSCDTAW